MLHPLDGPRAKVTRAFQHALSLSKQCEAYAASNPITLTCRWEDDAHVAYLEGQVPPVYLGLSLGDVIHNLRSALDQLAWALAWSHSPEALDDERIARRIFFPITHSLKQFQEHRTIPYLPPDAAAKLEAEQPYNYPADRLHPGAAIQDWSNSDKHRVLMVALGQISADDLAIQANVPIDVNDITPLVEPSTLVDPTRGFLRIPAREDADIKFLPINVAVGVPTFSVSPPDVIGPPMIELLCAQVAKCVDSYEMFFEPTDWGSRQDEWISPDLPPPFGDPAAQADHDPSA
jgi:hypothetical protein